MEGQFENDLYNNSFSIELESDDELDTLQESIEWWMVAVDRLGVIPNDVYDYSFTGLFLLFRKAIDPELQDLVEELMDREIIP